MALPQVITRPDGSLYCDVSIESLGFLSFTPLCSLPIRYYGGKFQEMGHIFVEIARSTCPVDTGYLRDHNDYAADAGGIEMWSEAFYSAYQEYGTSRCRAQPWFESSIMTALAESGIEEEFKTTQTRYMHVDGELSAIQSATPMSIGDCYALIDRINRLQSDLIALGIDVDGLNESLEQLEWEIEDMAEQMAMQASAAGAAGGGILQMLMQLLVAMIVSAIMAMIREIFSAIFEFNTADANPHNPSH